MPKTIILALLTLFLISCGQKSITPVKPPADKLVCAAMPQNPKLTPLDWGKVKTVDEAKSLVFKREGEVADYIVLLRGAWYSCSSTVAWHNDFFSVQ